MFADGLSMAILTSPAAAPCLSTIKIPIPAARRSSKAVSTSPPVQPPERRTQLDPSGPSLLQIDAAVPAGVTAFANQIDDLIAGDIIDRPASPVARRGRDLIGDTLSVTSNGATETFALSGESGGYAVSSDGTGGTMVTVVNAVAPTISGAGGARYAVAGAAAIQPFAGVSFADGNASAANASTSPSATPPRPFRTAVAIARASPRSAMAPMSSAGPPARSRRKSTPSN